jgi:biotin carboxyl carrier protein
VSDDQRNRREIARLAEEVLPALIGRLGASDLGELEVREGEWRVRLRKLAPAAAAAPDQGRSKRRGKVVPIAAPAPDDAAPSGEPPAASPVAQPPSIASLHVAASGNGTHPALAPVGPGRTAPPPRTELARRAATSPAVGFYVPNEQVTPGHRVKNGDVLGHIDVLGVRQEVVSPADGIIGRLLAESGEAVEYGQELLRIDLVAAGERAHDRGGDG